MKKQEGRQKKKREHMHKILAKIYQKKGKPKRKKRRGNKSMRE